MGPLRQRKGPFFLSGKNDLTAGQSGSLNRGLDQIVSEEPNHTRQYGNENYSKDYYGKVFLDPGVIRKIITTEDKGGYP